MPAAARISDYHQCPDYAGPVPHQGGPVSAGCTSVMIGSQPAARVGDPATCVVGGQDVIQEGEPSVLIGGAPAARMGDPTAHGGVIQVGCPTVIIGTPPQVLKTDKPFCADCERKRKEREAAQARAS